MDGWGGGGVDFGMSGYVFLVDGGLHIEIGQLRGRPEEATKGMNESRIGGLTKMADKGEVVGVTITALPKTSFVLFFLLLLWFCCCAMCVCVGVCVCVCVCGCVCVCVCSRWGREEVVCE